MENITAIGLDIAKWVFQVHGVFNKIFSALAATSDADDVLMIDATHLKAHRTAASLLKKDLFPDISDAPRAA